jgi:uncharacterized membrane protein YheB (UPF0754 family)
MMDLQLLLFMSVGGFIGWITNKIAIKMLFRPIKPVNLLFFTLQGVLPKRKSEIAVSIGETIEQQFVNKNELLSSLLDRKTKQSILSSMETILIQKINQLVPPMFLAMLGNGLNDLVRTMLQDHGDELIESMIEKLQSSDDVMPIKQMVTDKINALDITEFEQLVIGIVKRELRHIEVVGLVLGLVIGVAQYGISLLG